MFRCSHSLALYCWRGGIFDGGSVFNIGCRLRAYAVADAAARKEVSHACTRSLLRLHKESPLITKNGCVITEGAASGVGAHTAVAMAWRTPSRWRRWRMDNPLARPRFDHFHSLFSPQPTSLAHSPSLSRAASRKTVSREDHFPEIQLLSSRILPPASDALLCFIGCDCDDVCDNRRLRDVRV